MITKTECPECRDKSIDFYTGRCDKCGFILDKTPKDIAQQHVEDVVIPYQLQKLDIKKDDFLIIRPKKPITQNDAERLYDLFEESSDEPFNIVILNEDIDLETFTDKDLKEIGLQKIEKKEKEFLVKTGLSIERGDDLYDRFWGRVMFPIHSLAGRVIGFGARTLRSDPKAAKYLNSPESDIYHKSSSLYGLYFARQALVKEDKCFLVEGYTDVLSFYQSGLENVVASSGTALTEDQIRLIRRFTPNVTIILSDSNAS